MNKRGWTKKDFDELTKEDLKEIVAKVNEGRHITKSGKLGKPWSPMTKKNFKLALKVFYRWLEDIDEPRFYPDRVRWISTTIPKRDRKELGFDDIVTREEVIKMAQQGLNPMHKAFVWVCFESTGRPEENLNLNYSDIKFDSKGVVVMLNGAKDERPARLVSAVEPLRNWLRVHPLQNMKDYPIWVTQFSKVGKRKLKESEKELPPEEKWTMLQGKGGNKILKVLAKRSGITKRVTMYSLRKGRLTELAKSPEISSSLLKSIVGWTQSSAVADRYIKFSHKDIDRAILKTNGFLVEGEKIESFIECKWCGTKCSPGSLYCENIKCGKPLIITDSEIKALKKEMGIIEKKRKLLEQKIVEVYPVLKILGDHPELIGDLKNKYGRKYSTE